MKKISVLAAFFCLLLTASAALAQSKATSFAGTWELDVAKSKMPERMRVESMTLNVTQTDKEIKVATDSKRPARPEGDRLTAGDGSGGGMRPGGGMGRGGMGGGNGTVTYSLDGKQAGTVTRSDTSANASTAVTMSMASMEKDGILKLVSSRSFDTPNGSKTTKTTETWELTDGGNGLKVMLDMETPRGTQSSEMYFTRKVSSDMGKGTAGSGSEVVNPSADSASGNTQVPKRISKGVINGSALSLTKPSYPAEARESKASGAVSVQVEIDEQGNVVSAKAVSGDTMLRAASEEAARSSKFAPTMLSGTLVKVTGIIVYNFVAP